MRITIFESGVLGWMGTYLRIVGHGDEWKYDTESDRPMTCSKISLRGESLQRRICCRETDDEEKKKGFRQWGDSCLKIVEGEGCFGTALTRVVSDSD